MKLSLFSTALFMAIGLSAALPNGKHGKDDNNDNNDDEENKKSPPGPPNSSYGSVSQTCSASQSSIHCCQANGGQGKNHQVKYQNNQYNLVCSQITGQWSQNVQSICSTTVACCVGEYCTAIAY